MDGKQAEKDSMLSRRGFVSGALVVGTSLVGAAALAGCGGQGKVVESGDSNKASASSSDDASGKRHSDGWVDTENTAPIQPVDPPASWDKEADVVVVGAGGGGCIATCRLALEGKSVILCEKADHVGGSTQEASVIGAFGGCDRIWKDNWGFFGTPYNPQDVFDHTIAESKATVDRDLLWAMIDASPKSLDFMMDQGIDLCEMLDGAGLEGVYTTMICPRESARGVITRKQKPITDRLSEVAEDAGAEILLNTPVSTLVSENGKVVGVVVKDEASGQEMFIRAKEAVLLTAGGMACNRDMMLRYIPALGIGATTSTLMPTTTGECIRMGLGMGAAIAGTGSYTVRDGGVELPENAKSMFRSSRDGAEIMGRQPWLNVNKRGQRLTYYSCDLTDFLGIGHAEAKSAGQELSTFGQRRIVLFDGNYMEYTKSFTEKGARVLNTPDMPGVSDSPAALVDHNWHDGFDRGVKSGIIKQADTLEELAPMLDMEVEDLTRAISEWNEACAKGEDESEYGYRPEWQHPIDTPPFYGMRVGAAVQGTNAGLSVTPSMEVIAENGQVIPGLYAGFMTAGGGLGLNGMESITYGETASSYIGGYLASGSILKQ